jgi:outer membrane murein-binding lipoprotein Lpp
MLKLLLLREWVITSKKLLVLLAAVFVSGIFLVGCGAKVQKDLTELRADVAELKSEIRGLRTVIGTVQSEQLQNYLNIVDIKAGDEPWNDAEECKDVVGELT